MNELLQPSLIVVLCLPVPVLPFLGLGSRFDAQMVSWLEHSVSTTLAANPFPHFPLRRHYE